ncbi:hypothetical protein ROZALSC1DRAFT_26025, partial [Rozella allomycis CSF55]
MSSIAFFNANGVVGKADNIMHFFNSQNIDLLILGETWLSSGDNVPFKNCCVYNACHESDDIILRGGRRGRGGLLILGKKRNEFFVIKEDPHKRWVLFRYQNLLCCATYLEPSADDSILDDIFSMLDEETNGFEDEFVFLGDINARNRDICGD